MFLSRLQDYKAGIRTTDFRWLLHEGSGSFGTEIFAGLLLLITKQLNCTYNLGSIQFTDNAGWCITLIGCDNIPIVLCGNKVDVKNRHLNAKQVTFHRNKNFQCHEFSVKSNYNFEKPFLYLARNLSGSKFSRKTQKVLIKERGLSRLLEIGGIYEDCTWNSILSLSVKLPPLLCIPDFIYQLSSFPITI